MPGTNEAFSRVKIDAQLNDQGSKRDAMFESVRTVKAFASVEPDTFIAGKKTVFPGIGPDSLRKFHDRAKLLSTKDARPFARTRIEFPASDRELFFDIEVDPI